MFAEIILDAVALQKLDRKERKVERKRKRRKCL